MKKIWIQISCIAIFLHVCPLNAQSAFKDIWNRDFRGGISEKLFSIDIDKNGIKEILIIHDATDKKMSVIEWQKGKFKEKFSIYEPENSLRLKYYDFNDYYWLKSSALSKNNFIL